MKTHFGTFLFVFGFSLSSLASEMAGPLPGFLYGITIDDISNTRGIIDSLKHIVRKPTARVVFDYEMGPEYYSAAVQKIHEVSFVMGQVADSSDMAKFNPLTYRQRARSFYSQLSKNIDIWEVGNEVNGNWLGTNAFENSLAAFGELSAKQARTAMTFYYEGERADTKNCIPMSGQDMISWIKDKFQLQKDPKDRPVEIERMRLGLTYVFVSWYPDQCNDLEPKWTEIFDRLSQIFPQAKLGVGEIGPAKPQNGSAYEAKLLGDYYSLAATYPMPKNYVGGNFWWHFVAEMVPYNKTPLMDIMNKAILKEPREESPGGRRGHSF